MRRSLRASLAAAAFAVALGPSAWGWDTRTDKVGDAESWTSIYYSQNLVPSFNGTSMVGVVRNEHAELSDLTLQMIGAAPVLGRGAHHTLNVVDLNASLFRPELRKIGTRTDDTAIKDSPLEQRLLPAVPQWAGVPDFGYSIDDWINKGQLCPPRPPGNAKNNTCHVYFGGWLAGFNSGHFGTQSALTYASIHNTALQLARRAADLRQRLRGSGRPEDLEAHRDKVEEAELLALYYEGAAQHFLQDRWSTGHMWERWSAPDYAQNVYRDDVYGSSQVGAASGLLHGSEALTGLPDSVSSPYFAGLSTLSAVSNIPGGGSNRLEFGPDTAAGNTALEMTRFRLGPEGPDFTGVGDERMEDLFDGNFGKEYGERANTDVPIPVAQQRTMMMACLAGSWASVIRALGPAESGTGQFGQLAIPLAAPYSGDYAPRHTCTDMWLTNRSVYLGWVNDTIALPIGVVGRTFLSGAAGNLVGALSPAAGAVVNTYLLGMRDDFVAVTARVAWREWRDPNGTDLARGGLGDMGDAKPGNAYGAPSYLTPADLSLLPERDETGVDKQAIFGFFNRANADYFCTDLAERLRDLRGSKDPVKQEACRYLAERAWSGTDPRYTDGVQKEERIGPNGNPARSICSFFDGGARIDLTSYDEETPQWLHPGYVPIRQGKSLGDSPYQMAAHNVSSQSIANWCDKVPVLNLLRDPEPFNADVVAEQNDPTDEITVTGLQLGDDAGMLKLQDLQGKEYPGLEVVDWSDRQIRFKLPEEFDADSDELLLSLTRADGIPSVGRFVLKISPVRPEIERVVISRNDEELYRDDGDAEAPSKYKPIGPGPLDIEIRFANPMAREPVNGRKEEVKLGNTAVEGRWESATRWRGLMTVPMDAAYAAMRGMLPLSIQAATREGGWIDSDPDVPGRQPDETRRVVVDELPVFVKTVRVEGPQGVFYRGNWSDEPDIQGADNVLTKVFRGPARRLFVPDADAVPAQGQARITLDLTAPVMETPHVTIGGHDVMLTGKDASWAGTFDLASIAELAKDDLVPVVVTVKDHYGRNTDSDPRTPTTVTLPDKGVAGPWWKRYERIPGEDSNGTGGDDRWHKLGVPPVASIVIVLDASGSMSDNDKMTNAKNGIVAALAKLPPNVEVGAVAFSGCTGINSFPFTKKVTTAQANLLGVQANGSTPLAAALARARVMLEAEAHPLSRSWSYLPFSDGEENCNGNVGAEMQRLESSITAHQRRQLPPLGDPEDLANAPSDDPEDNLPKIACNPTTRTAYDFDVRDGGLHLDNISLTETTFTEQETAAGVCQLTLVTKRFGVYYGQSRGKVIWRVNSGPSRTTTERAGSRDGADAVEAFRARANARLDEMQTMQNARSEIDRAVQRSLAKA